MIGTRNAITSRRIYSRVDFKRSPNSQQEVHKEKKLASNGYTFAWEEGANSLG
jgi:hypothetical protein